MGGWGDILAELNQSAVTNNGIPDFDGVRRGYIPRLQALTGRSVIVYATDFLNSSGQNVSINLSDKYGLMEVFRDLPGPNLDIILHSPGGSAEAAESLVGYMRSKFDHIRVYVPLAAMSAATMWALAADEIVMGKHSQLGPIDPQLGLRSGYVPAGALLRQFKTASDECAQDASRLAAWMPTLQQYTPGLLDMCAEHTALAKELVTEWLKKYMLKDEADPAGAAEKVADFFGDDTDHHVHGRPIMRDRLRELNAGLKILDLEEDPALQDAVLSVHHATMHSLSGPAVKIIENHLDRTFIVMGAQQLVMPMPVVQPQQITLPTGTVVG